ncbi:MAG TPA: hypothetical protein VNY83_06805 [Solirubrobacterales bacterium]|nr:hypothetical protein [Solirubrobacterales bacterium]
MDHPLEGFVLKISRAEKHLESIKQMVDSFCESDFYETATEKYGKGRLVARAKNVKDPEPELSILIGDCVFNYRSALDQLAYALAAAHTDPLPEKLANSSAFPIYPTGPKFRGHGARPAAHKIAGMSRGARARIEELQPYHRRKDPPLAALWRLEELSNIDKHRLIHVTGAVGIRSQFRIEGAGMYRLTGLQPVFCPIEENAIVGHFWGEFDLEAGVKVDANIAPEVVFDRRSEAHSVRGESVFLALLAIRECIILRVLPCLEPELHRLFPGIGIKVHRGPVEQYERIPALFASAEMAGQAQRPASTKKGYA